MYKKVLASVLVIPLLTINSASYADSAKTRSIIRNVKNQVELKYVYSLWRPAHENQTVIPGTQIRTGALSKVELLYNDGTVTRIGSRTSITVLDRESRQLEISSGNLWFKVTKKSYGLKIYAPKAVAAITGTEGGVKVDQIEEIKTDKSNINVTVKKGTLTLNNEKGPEKEKDANVTVVVAEGTVNTTVAKRTFIMTPGDKVSFSTVSTAKVEHKNIGIDNTRIMFESSQSETIASNPATSNNSYATTNDVTKGIPMAKMISLKSNMEILKVMAENYMADNGVYPDNLNVLFDEAKKKNYYKSIKNPFNGRTGEQAVKEYNQFKPSNGEGIVLYDTFNCTLNLTTNHKNCDSYKIYGTELSGNLLKSKGQVYILSNN